MSTIFQQQFVHAPWLPKLDAQVVDEAIATEIDKKQGFCYEHPQFQVQVMWDVHNVFSTDLFYRIKQSDVQNKKLVLLLPSPENAVFISLAEVLNKYRVSCRNVHVFFLYEYANEKGQVAPYNSPYSRSGHFIRYFYNRVDQDLRMPWEQIHFWTDDNIDSYSDLIAREGGLDVAYTTLSWSGGIGAIDAQSFPAASVDELMQMGSRYVTPMPENIAMDSLRGMFGCSGDIGNVPPCAVTVGPKDIAGAKERIHLQYLAACGGTPALQKTALKLALFAPVCTQVPGSIMRLMSGICYVSADVAQQGVYRPDALWLRDTIDAIAKQEENL